METLLTHWDWQTGLQLLLDVILLILVLSLLLRRPKLPTSDTRDVVASFEKIIEETKTLGAEFEKNLQERSTLIRQVLEGLDAKLEEARNIVQKLERLTSPSPERNSSPEAPDPETILNLAQRGLSVQEIARRTRRPIGEVELVLNLEKLARKKG